MLIEHILIDQEYQGSFIPELLHFIPETVILPQSEKNGFVSLGHVPQLWLQLQREVSPLQCHGLACCDGRCTVAGYSG